MASGKPGAVQVDLVASQDEIARDGILPAARGLEIDADRNAMGPTGVNSMPSCVIGSRDGRRRARRGPNRQRRLALGHQPRPVDAVDLGTGPRHPYRAAGSVALGNLSAGTIGSLFPADLITFEDLGDNVAGAKSGGGAVAELLAFVTDHDD